MSPLEPPRWTVRATTEHGALNSVEPLSRADAERIAAELWRRGVDASIELHSASKQATPKL